MASVVNKVKHAVSKKKRRFKDDGFDLDLTYINPRIVAMGFPAEKIEGLYRNHMDEVVKFFDMKHPNHYKVYNLCSERTYDPSRFHGRVALYQFEDHNAPPFELMHPFCSDVEEFLSQDPDNVVVIHCKAGKGRTGVMICAFLIFKKLVSSYKEGLEVYGLKRTQNNKGVTIPSQRRYVKYFDFYLRYNLTYAPTTILLYKMFFEGVPSISNSGCCAQFTIRQAKVKIYTSKVYEMDRDKSEYGEMELSPPAPVCGDIKVEFFHATRYRTTEKMFHFWLNTFFVNHGCLDDTGNSIPHSRSCGTSSGMAAGVNKTMSNDNVTVTGTRPSRTFGSASSASAMGIPPYREATTVQECDSAESGFHSSDSAAVSTLSPRAQIAAYQSSPKFRVITVVHQNLDKANKDRRHYPPNFKLHLVFSGCDQALNPPVDNTSSTEAVSSSSSEEDLYNYSDTDPEDYEDWSDPASCKDAPPVA